MRRLSAAILVTGLSLGVCHAAFAAPPDDEAARLAAIEKDNATLRKEIAALRERERLMTEKAGVQQRVERRSPPGRPVYAAVNRAQPAGPIYASADPAPPYKAPYSPPAAYSWTGCYVGVNAGYAWGHEDSLVGTFLAAHPEPDGAVAGGTLGCNYQTRDNWILGVEGDFAWANVKGNDPTAINPVFVRETSFDWYSTIRGRLGFAIDHTLLFVTGGAAFANIKERESNSTTVDQSVTQTKTGWVIGGGAEWALANPQWSVKVEYLYTDFGTSHLEGTGVTSQQGNLHENLVRVGVNYRFGGPVSAKY